jgi:hypothetical protein
MTNWLKMDLKETVYNYVDWNHLARDRLKQRAAEKTVINISINET